MLKISFLTSLLFLCVSGLAQANGDLRNVKISKTSPAALCTVQSAKNQILTGSLTPTITSLGGGIKGQDYGLSRLYIFFSAKDSAGKQLNYNLVLNNTGPDFTWIWVDNSAYGDPVSVSADLFQIDEPDVFLLWKEYTHLGEVNISTCQ